jgi:hypothetical protein
MTLLQTWICPTGILQVSDRRLTNARTGKVVDDVFNKSVSWCARRTVGFTGIGYLGRNQKEPVSHFIAKTLADHLSFEAGIEALRVAATEEVASAEPTAELAANPACPLTRSPDRSAGPDVRSRPRYPAQLVRHRDEALPARLSGQHRRNQPTS